MLKIGEFSTLSKISIYMLRHYNEINLLMPVYIDDSTGYRYYSEEQLPVANRIQALKGMGMGLNAIKDMLSANKDDDKFKKYLSDKAGEKRKEIELLQKQLLQIETTHNDIDNYADFSGCIAIKEIPERKVICYRNKINSFDCEGELWCKLSEETIRQNVQFANPQYCIAILHGEDAENGILDIEVQKSVMGSYKDIEQIQFKVVKPITAATLIFKGGYDKLYRVNEAVARWITNNNYELDGHIFNIYHVSPESESLMDNLITEVCFPIKERN